LTCLGGQIFAKSWDALRQLKINLALEQDIPEHHVPFTHTISHSGDGAGGTFGAGTKAEF
jgi:hypothetical protein